jgi:hypothetical protein
VVEGVTVQLRCVAPVFPKRQAQGVVHVTMSELSGAQFPTPNPVITDDGGGTAGAKGSFFRALTGVICKRQCIAQARRISHNVPAQRAENAPGTARGLEKDQYRGTIVFLPPFTSGAQGRRHGYGC